MSSTRVDSQVRGDAGSIPNARLSRLRLTGGAWETLWPLGLYAVLALLAFGLPIAAHPRGTIIGADEVDPSQFMWFFTWWPWALTHGVDPFTTYHQFVPDGYNLQWAASMPLAGVVLSPITWTVGPEVSWNLFMLACPALGAWTGYLLCRHVTGRLWPSIVGGYLFGFSPYMLGSMTGTPNLAFVALVPLFALLVLKWLDGSLGTRAFLVAMAAAFTVQFLTSTEVLLTSTIFGATALAVAFLLLPDRRRDLLRVTGLLFAAGAAMAVVVSPFLYHFFFGEHFEPVATYFATDASAFVLPPHLVALTPKPDAAAGFRGAVTTTYVGLPLILLSALFLWQRRRERIAWVLLLCALIPAVASLGPGLILRGKLTDVTLPWDLVNDLPLIQHALPVRFALFVILPLAIVVAMWLTTGGRARWALAILVVLTFLPAVGDTFWKTSVSDPAFFSEGRYRDRLRSADRVITIPAMGANERYQAKTKMAFKIAGGYLGTNFPEGYTRFPTWQTLLNGQLTPDYARQLRRFVDAKGVTAIVVDKRYGGPWRQLFGSLGVRPEDTGGVLYYRLSEPSG